MIWPAFHCSSAPQGGKGRTTLSLFFFLRFLKFYFQPFGLWQTLGSAFTDIHWLLPLYFHSWFILPFWITAAFGLSLSWVYPSKSLPAWSVFLLQFCTPLLLPLLSFLILLSKTVSSKGATTFPIARCPASNHLSAWLRYKTLFFSGSLTSLSSFFPPSTAFGVQILNRLHWFLEPPAFRYLYHPYSNQKKSLLLRILPWVGILWCVLLKSVSKYWINNNLCLGNIMTATTSFHFLYLCLVPLAFFLSRTSTKLFLIYASEPQCSSSLSTLSARISRLIGVLNGLISMG